MDEFNSLHGRNLTMPVDFTVPSPFNRFLSVYSRKHITLCHNLSIEFWKLYIIFIKSKKL